MNSAPSATEKASIDTTVINPVTGHTLTFSLPPREAVNAAFEQGRGNWNTWTYANTLDLVRVSDDGKLAIRGDFVARVNITEVLE